MLVIGLVAGPESQVLVSWFSRDSFTGGGSGKDRGWEFLQGTCGCSLEGIPKDWIQDSCFVSTGH